MQSWQGTLRKSRGNPALAETVRSQQTSSSRQHSSPPRAQLPARDTRALDETMRSARRLQSAYVESTSSRTPDYSARNRNVDQIRDSEHGRIRDEPRSRDRERDRSRVVHFVDEESSSNGFAPQSVARVHAAVPDTGVLIPAAGEAARGPPFDPAVAGPRLGAYRLAAGAAAAPSAAAVPFVLPAHHVPEFVAAAVAGEPIATATLPARFPFASRSTTTTDAFLLSDAAVAGPVAALGGGVAAYGGAAVAPVAVVSAPSCATILDAGVVALASHPLPPADRNSNSDALSGEAWGATALRRLLFAAGRAVVRLSLPLYLTVSPTDANSNDTAGGANWRGAAAAVDVAVTAARNGAPQQHWYRGHGDNVTTMATIPRRATASSPRSSLTVAGTRSADSDVNAGATDALPAGSLVVSVARRRAVNLSRVCVACAHDAALTTVARLGGADARCPAAAIAATLTGAAAALAGTAPGTPAAVDCAACAGVCAAALHGRALLETLAALADAQTRTGTGATAAAVGASSGAALPPLPEPAHYAALRVQSSPPPSTAAPAAAALIADGAAYIAGLYAAVSAPLRPAAGAVRNPGTNGGAGAAGPPALSPLALARWAATPFLPLAAELRLWCPDSLRTAVAVTAVAEVSKSSGRGGGGVGPGPVAAVGWAQCTMPLPLHYATRVVASAPLPAATAADSDAADSEPPVLLAVVGYRFGGLPVAAPPRARGSQGVTLVPSGCAAAVAAAAAQLDEEPEGGEQWALDARGGLALLATLAPSQQPARAISPAAAAAAEAAATEALAAAWAGGVTAHGYACPCSTTAAAATKTDNTVAAAVSPLLPHPAVLSTAAAPVAASSASVPEGSRAETDAATGTLRPQLRAPALPPPSQRRSCVHESGCARCGPVAAASAAAVRTDCVAVDYDGGAAAAAAGGPGSSGLWAELRRRSGWQPYRADRRTDAAGVSVRSECFTALQSDEYWLRDPARAPSRHGAAAPAPCEKCGGRATGSTAAAMAAENEARGAALEGMSCAAAVAGCEPVKEWYLLLYRLRPRSLTLPQRLAPGAPPPPPAQDGPFCSLEAAVALGGEPVTGVEFTAASENATASVSAARGGSPARVVRCALTLTSAGGAVRAIDVAGPVVTVSAAAAPAPPPVARPGVCSCGDSPINEGTTPADTVSTADGATEWEPSSPFAQRPRVPATPLSGSTVPSTPRWAPTPVFGSGAPTPLRVPLTPMRGPGELGAFPASPLVGTPMTSPGSATPMSQARSAALRRKQSLFSTAATATPLPGGDSAAVGNDDLYAAYSAAHAATMSPAAARALAALPWGAPLATALLVISRARPPAAVRPARGESALVSAAPEGARTVRTARSAFHPSAPFAAASTATASDDDGEPAVAVVGDAWGRLHLWRRGRCVHTVLAHAYAYAHTHTQNQHGFDTKDAHCPVTALAAAPHGFASAGADGRIVLWQLRAAGPAAAAAGARKGWVLEPVAAFDVAAALCVRAEAVATLAGDDSNKGSTDTKDAAAALSGCLCARTSLACVASITHLGAHSEAVSLPAPPPQLANLRGGASTRTWAAAARVHVPGAFVVGSAGGRLHLLSPATGALTPLFPASAVASAHAEKPLPCVSSAMRVAALAPHPTLPLAALLTVSFNPRFARETVVPLADETKISEPVPAWTHVELLDSSTLATLPRGALLPAAATAAVAGALIVSNTPPGSNGSNRLRRDCLAVGLASGQIALLSLPALQPLLAFSLPQLVCGPRERVAWAAWARQSALQRVLLQELHVVVARERANAPSAFSASELLQPRLLSRAGSLNSSGSPLPMLREGSAATAFGLNSARRSDDITPLQGLRPPAEPAVLLRGAGGRPGVTELNLKDLSDSDSDAGNPCEDDDRRNADKKNVVPLAAVRAAVPVLADLGLGIGALALSPCGCFLAVATRAADWQPPGAELLLSALAPAPRTSEQTPSRGDGALRQLYALGLAHRLPQALPGAGPSGGAASTLTVGSALSPCVVTVVQVGATVADNFKPRAGAFRARLHCVVRAHTAPVVALSFSQGRPASILTAGSAAAEALAAGATLLVSSDASGALVYTRLRDGVALSSAAALTDGVPCAADAPPHATWPHAAGARGRVLAGGLEVTVPSVTTTDTGAALTAAPTALPATTTAGLAPAAASLHSSAMGVPVRLSEAADGGDAAARAVGGFLTSAARRGLVVPLPAAALAPVASAADGDPRDAFLRAHAGHLLQYCSPLALASAPGALPITPLVTLCLAPVSNFKNDQSELLGELTAAGLASGAVLLHSASLNALPRSATTAVTNTSVAAGAFSEPPSIAAAAAIDADAAVLALTPAPPPGALARALDDPPARTDNTDPGGALQRLWAAWRSGDVATFATAVEHVLAPLALAAPADEPAADAAAARARARAAAGALLSDAVARAATIGAVLTVTNALPLSLTVALSSSTFARHQPALRDALAAAVMLPHSAPGSGIATVQRREVAVRARLALSTRDPGPAPRGAAGAGGATPLSAHQPAHSPWIAAVTAWRVAPVAALALARAVAAVALRPASDYLFQSPVTPPEPAPAVVAARAAAARAVAAAERARAPQAVTAAALEADAFQAQALALLLRGQEDVAAIADAAAARARPASARAEAIARARARDEACERREGRAENAALVAAAPRWATARGPREAHAAPASDVSTAIGRGRAAAEARAGAALGAGLRAAEAWQRRHGLPLWPGMPRAAAAAAAATAAAGEPCAPEAEPEALARAVAAARVLADELDDELKRAQVRLRRGPLAPARRPVSATMSRADGTMGLGLGCFPKGQFAAVRAPGAVTTAAAAAAAATSGDIAHRISALLNAQAADDGSYIDATDDAEDAESQAEQRGARELHRARQVAVLAGVDSTVASVLNDVHRARREQASARRALARAAAALDTAERGDALPTYDDALSSGRGGSGHGEAAAVSARVEALRRERQRAAAQLAQSQHLLGVERLVWGAAAEGARAQVRTGDGSAVGERELRDAAAAEAEAARRDEAVLRRQAQLLESRIAAALGDSAAHRHEMRRGY